MALLHSPRIVTNGLVLCLDAANRKSYPGSGTVWRDLAGSNNGTLTNGPTFNGSNRGSIFFDGVDDYVSLPISNSLQNTSYTMFGFLKSNVSIQNGSSERYLFYFRGTTTGSNRFGVLFGLSSNVGANNGGLNLIIGNGGWNGYSSSRRSWDSNTWYNIAVTQNGTTYIMYVNGVQINTGTAVIPQFSGITNNDLGILWNGNIVEGLVYNRALTPAEILQNYNAIKGRYNL